MTTNSRDDDDDTTSTSTTTTTADSNNPTVQRLREFRLKTQNQEDMIAAQPKSTKDNPFPDHKHPTQEELKKYNAKPDPKSLRTNPKGGCDY
jgi:hypothetical protein